MIELRSGVVLILAAVLWLVGCGSSAAPVATGDASMDTGAETKPDDSQATADISGWFRVTSDLEGACGATMPYTLGSPYLWVEHQMSRYVVHACAGTTAADCTGTYFYDFTTPIDGGWSAEGATAFFSAGCTLTLERTDLTLTGDELHARSLTDRINQDLPQTACTLEAARMLTGPCTREVEIVAARL